MNVLKLINLFFSELHETLLYSIIKDFLFPLLLALVSVVSAYLIFFRQLINEKQKENREKEEALKNKLTYFAMTVHNAIENAMAQNDNLQTLIQELKREEVNSLPLILTPLTDLKILAEKIDNESYLLSYLDFYSKAKKSESLKTFKIIMDNSITINQMIKQNNENLQKKMDLEFKGKKKFSNNSSKVADLLGKCSQNMKDTNNPLFNEIIKIHIGSDQLKHITGDQHLIGQYHLLIVPLLKLLDSWHLKRIEFDENTGNLWIAAKKGVDIFEYLKTNNQLLLGLLVGNFNYTNKLILEIEEASKTLRNDFLN